VPLNIPAAFVKLEISQLSMSCVFDGNKTIKGGHDAGTLHTTATKTTLHGLGGNDTLTGAAVTKSLK
jgi:Ca2+-binding RTX toxin-like protein